jgi:hypothetical protein
MIRRRADDPSEVRWQHTSWAYQGGSDHRGMTHLDASIGGLGVGSNRGLAPTYTELDSFGVRRREESNVRLAPNSGRSKESARSRR